MSTGTIVFVHGTGVRLRNYRPSFDAARKRAAAVGIGAKFIECAWGDPLGVEFKGLSLPDPPSPGQLLEEEEDFARWSWLFDDPLFELDKLTIRDISEVKRPLSPPGRRPAWLLLWEKIAAYKPSLELDLLLKRGDLQDFWPTAWPLVIDSEVARLAFDRSSHELPEASNALARAIVAQLHVEAVAADRPGPSRELRDSLVSRLVDDWGQVVYARSGFFVGLIERAATRMLRSHRNGFSDMAALPVGDVLLYQARGAEVRDFIRAKIATAAPPVTLVAHSLGGIACVDLLALDGAPPVSHLVTVGSQSPLLYEIGALASLKPPQVLPNGFPPWLNIYDRSDFLSYVAKRLFPRADDLEVDSGQPFPDSHSAYFTNEQVWTRIRDFLSR
jgi:hypothetical protein